MLHTLSIMAAMQPQPLATGSSIGNTFCCVVLSRLTCLCRSQVEMSNALTMKTQASLPTTTADQDDDEDDFFSQSVDDEQAAAEMMADIMAGTDPRRDSIDITIEPQKQLPGISCA